MDISKDHILVLDHINELTRLRVTEENSARVREFFQNFISRALEVWHLLRTEWKFPFVMGAVLRRLVQITPMDSLYYVAVILNKIHRNVSDFTLLLVITDALHVKFYNEKDRSSDVVRAFLTGTCLGIFQYYADLIPTKPSTNSDLIARLVSNTLTLPAMLGADTEHFVEVLRDTLNSEQYAWFYKYVSENAKTLIEIQKERGVGHVNSANNLKKTLCLGRNIMPEELDVNSETVREGLQRLLKIAETEITDENYEMVIGVLKSAISKIQLMGDPENIGWRIYDVIDTILRKLVEVIHWNDFNYITELHNWASGNDFDEYTSAIAESIVERFTHIDPADVMEEEDLDSLTSEIDTCIDAYFSEEELENEPRQCWISDLLIILALCGCNITENGLKLIDQVDSKAIWVSFNEVLYNSVIDTLKIVEDNGTGGNDRAWNLRYLRELKIKWLEED